MLDYFTCGECGHNFDFESADLEPAVSDLDRQHSNYDTETDSVVICPACYQAMIAQDEANYRRYASGIEYACGIRD